MKEHKMLRHNPTGASAHTHTLIMSVCEWFLYISASVCLSTFVSVRVVFCLFTVYAFVCVYVVVRFCVCVCVSGRYFYPW